MATQLGSLKRLRGFPAWCVDGFNFQRPNEVEAYVLTHFHADHTTGLTSGFKARIQGLGIRTLRALRVRV